MSRWSKGGGGGEAASGVVLLSSFANRYHFHEKLTCGISLILAVNIIYSWKRLAVCWLLAKNNWGKTPNLFKGG